ncbi:glycoside hydrolase family 9 protein [Cerasicoccus frondis]|uniref:glycoside hydrolase family 9 protein n=1 Tax=Cerasicoccus frondis TaxID=490090 RepID=UPI0028527844|nr:glycoside hydrolase family 9 protein [Cerasicoccus frondis]
MIFPFAHHQYMNAIIWAAIASLACGASILAADVSEPSVERVFAVGPNMLVVEIQAQSIPDVGQRLYMKEPGDRIEAGKGAEVFAWGADGVSMTSKNQALHRAKHRGKFADYTEVYGSWEPTIWLEETVGSPLDLTKVDEPGSYKISGDSLLGIRTPTSVSRKSKPTNRNDITGTMPYSHVLTLELDDSLVEGAEYRIAFPGLNTAQDAVTYRHLPRKIRSDAVQVSQVGFRPDDPYKRAYLSFWAGTKGGISFDVDRFEIIDANSKETVYEGDIVLGWPADKAEGTQNKKNNVQADVYYLDFHDFTRPGTYQIYVPGVGCSFPFEIGNDVWLKAFRKSMKGFFAHRSGIELKAPFSAYERPRPMHPADGFIVFELDVTRMEGESEAVQASFQRMLGNENNTDQLDMLPEAWGGYMDAGDWDRRSQHLAASFSMIELFEMYPDFYADKPLSLTPTERSDDLPDLLNEAKWNVDFFRRLQTEDGGIRGGIESTSHPRHGEASWQETLLLGAFAPDPVSSYLYAASAAKLSRVIAPYDASAARAYLDSAKMAYDWAITNQERVFEEASKRTPNWNKQKVDGEIRTWAPMAAIELYRSTKDERYHQDAIHQPAFQNPQAIDWLLNFSYARLPDGMGEDSLKSRARKSFTNAADAAASFGQANAYGITTFAPGIPMMGYVAYYSTPETSIGPVLPRAYWLTGDEKYLKAALVAVNPTVGANPSNLVYTTGVGKKYPQAPLHIDSRVSGQSAPDGITVFGPSDPAGGWSFNEWVHQYVLKEMTPSSRQWPAIEAYVDLYRWPSMNEYTIQQTFRPTSFYWGALAARDQEVDR